MASTRIGYTLLGLPNELRHLIMLELFNAQDLAINLALNDSNEKYKAKALFSTAPLLVCQRMRYDALDILMCGIELRACCICEMHSNVDMILISLRRCIRYLDTTYFRDCCYHVAAPRAN